MRFGIQAEICLSCLIYPVLWIVHTQTHFKTLWKWFSLYVTSHPDIMGENNECHTGNLSSFTQPVNGRTYSWTQGNVHCGISGDSSRPLLPPHCLSCRLSTCSLKGWAQLLPCVSTQLVSLTTSWKYFTKQQWSRSRWILLLSPLPPPLFFKKHHHTYTYVILVFYGLKITHSRGGVSCALRHTASRKSLPTCVCTPSVPRPPPQAYTTTSMTMGGLTVDTISAATTS